MAVITDNATNIINATHLLLQITEKFGLTCAAHSLQLAVNKALVENNIEKLLVKSNKIVSHFNTLTLKCGKIRASRETRATWFTYFINLLQNCKIRTLA